MNYYSDYSKKYVQDICDAINSNKLYDIGRSVADPIINKPFNPDNFSSLMRFIQTYVVQFAYDELDKRNLVNTGRCPYTGQVINDESPYWSYNLNGRKLIVYLSEKGLELMKKEQSEEYNKLFGHPMPNQIYDTIKNKDKLKYKGIWYYVKLAFITIIIIIILIEILGRLIAS